MYQYLPLMLLLSLDALAQPTGTSEQPIESGAEVETSEGRLLTGRLEEENRNRRNRFVLTPNRRNYLLPVSYQGDRNFKPFEAADSPRSGTKETEVEFQFSVKVLIREAIFGDNGHLSVGYTNRSLWQAYDAGSSRPFRETNHQPEIMLSFTSEWEILGFRNVLNEIQYVHQSNGQSGALSRSWDRIMFVTTFERGPFAFRLAPWYRIPEDEKDGLEDPRGDDNPDIEDYLGNFEFAAGYKRNNQIVDMTLRHTLDSHNRGSIELGWSFPVSSTVRGYFKYFNGYGHTLIDYDHHANVFALGITFTDLF